MTGEQQHGWCRVCKGPCLTYKGNVHGWTCDGCLRAYLDAQFTRADRAAEARRRNFEARMRELVTVEMNGNGGGGGGLVTDRAAAPTARAEAVPA